MSNYNDYGYSNPELLHTHKYIFAQLLKILKAKKHQKNILDLGCGNGSVAIELLKENLEVYGVDGSVSGIEIANSSSPNRFFVQDFDKDELPEALLAKRFQTLIAIEVIEHIYNPQQFIEFCNKVFDKNAHEKTLILTTPYHGYLKNLLLSIFNKWDTHADPLWQGGHIKLWSKNTITKLLEKNGYQIVEIKGCGRFPYLWKSMLIHAVLK